MKRYNDRLLKEGGDDSEEGEDVDEEERDKTEISKVCMCTCVNGRCLCVIVSSASC